MRSPTPQESCGVGDRNDYLKGKLFTVLTSRIYDKINKNRSRNLKFLMRLMRGNTARKKRGKNFSKQKFIFLLKFLFPKNIFLSLLSGLVWAGLFSVVIYTFATPPTSPYTLGETLNPSCAPGSTNCTVTELAAYSFGSNNFSGTGNFVTTGSGSFGSLVLTTSALEVGYGGTGVASIAAGSVLAANTANTLTAINSTSGTMYLKNVDGTISWGEVSLGSYVPYTGATSDVNLGVNNIISSKLIGGSETTSDLSLQTTSGIGATGADMHFLVGNNGGTEAMTILNSGAIGIGTTTPQVSLHNNGDFITKGPWADVRAYGATGDGVTDDTTAVQAALTASLNVYFPAGTYLVSNLTAQTGQRIFGDGTQSSIRFKDGSTGYLFELSTKVVQFSNLDIDGGSNTDKSATESAGTRSGIHMSSNNTGSSIQNVAIHGFDNIGLAFNGLASQPGYVNPPVTTGVSVYYNYVGIDTGVGETNGAEYMRMSDINSFGNRYGIIINSGNMTFADCHIDGNGYGVTITDAFNNAHGTIVGSTINHNLLYGFYIDGASNGFSITGNQNYYSNVYVKDSTGINFRGNTFGSSTFTFSGGGVNMLEGNYFVSTPSFSRTNDNFIISDNYTGSSPTSVSSGLQIYSGLGSVKASALSTYAAPVNIVTPNPFSGTSTANSVPSLASNVAITTSDAWGKDIGGVLGLGGQYNTAVTYPQVIFGALRGGKSTVTDGDMAGYLGIYTNSGSALSEVARFDNNGYLGIGVEAPSQELDVVGDIELEDTTSDDTGVIYKGANRFLHNFHHPTGSTAVPTGQNTFVGEGAGNFTMGSTATETYHGSYNTGVGYQALQANTTGFYNTANGVSALYSNTTGSYNVANGSNALRMNTTGSYNTANGVSALSSNTTGSYNTANGVSALSSNTTGSYNTANGVSALRLNTTGNSNTANGMNALFSNKTGSNGVAIGTESQYYANDTLTPWTNYNTSVGYQALRGSTTAADNTGNYNTALGYQSLLNITTGSHNTAVGYMAGYYIAGGAVNNTISDYSVYLGNSTKASADNAQNEIVIGYDATGLGSNSVVLGNSSITTTVLRGAVGIGVEAPSQELDVVGDIELEDTTSDDTGVIYKGANRFLHNFHHPTGSTAVPTGQNTFVGEGAGNFTMGSTATETYHGSYNTGVGYQALQANTTGFYNTANGVSALYSNTTGSYNVANGSNALRMNTTGSYNTANGVSALFSNKTGSNGVAIGYDSQRYANDTAVAWANYNTSVGYQALRGSTTAANNTGNENSVFGYQTLYANTSGQKNSAIGTWSLYSNTTGSYNTGIGWGTLYNNTTGNSNIALGYEAGRYIADGSTSNTTSDYSIYIGRGVKASADDAQNEIVIGYNTTGQGNNTITFGNTSMVGAYFLADDYKTYWGAGKNASINYDGDNMYFNSQEVGVGSFIFSGGNVGIGTVTTPTNAKLVVNGGIAVGADALNNTISTGSLGDGTTTLYVGTYTVDTTAPSDIITKEEIVSTSYGLEDLLKLSVKNYKYKRQYVNEGAVQEEHTGLIAQDVEQIYPEAVIYRSDGLKAINYTKMIPLIISSIQELSAGKTLSDNGTWGEGTVFGLEDSSFTAQLKLAFTSLGIYIEKGVATFEEVIAQKATIKTAKVEGLEMVDKTTGEIWCTQISNGEWTKTKGECNPSVVTQETSTESSTQIETALEIQTTTQNEVSSEEIVEEVKEKVKEEVKEEVSQQVAEKIKDQVVQEVTEQVTEQITEAVQQVTEQSNEAKHSANEAQQSAKESQKHAEQAQQAVEKSTKQQVEEIEQEEAVEPVEAVETVETLEVESAEEPTVEQPQEEQQSSVGDLIQETTAGLFSGVMNFIKWLFGSAAQTVSKAVPADVMQSTASLSSSVSDNFIQGIKQIINDVKNILKF